MFSCQYQVTLGSEGVELRNRVPKVNKESHPPPTPTPSPGEDEDAVPRLSYRTSASITLEPERERSEADPGQSWRPENVLESSTRANISLLTLAW